MVRAFSEALGISALQMDDYSERLTAYKYFLGLGRLVSLAGDPGKAEVICT